MATFQSAPGVCYAEVMGCRAGLAVERPSWTVSAARACRACRVYRTWQLLLIATSACSFETQPIFDSRSDPVSDSDTATGQPRAALQSDAGSSSPTASTMSTTSTMSTMSMTHADAGVANNGDCTPDTSSCSDESTLLQCGSDGRPLRIDVCASGCDGSITGEAVCNICVPGKLLGCSDATSVRRCKDNGSGEETVRCPSGCSSGTCAGTCVPGATSCTDTATLRTCDALGATTERTCADGCSVTAGRASCNVCRPNALVCRGQVSIQCSADGQLASNTPCTHGCDAVSGACLPTRLLPANLPAETCDAQPDDDAELSGNTSLDTDANCTSVQQQAGDAPEICVVRHRDVHVLAGALITVSGSRALALVATRSLRIDGVISVAAHGGNAGPGALSTGPGVGHAATVRASGAVDIPANAGGGGGGHAAKGGAGGGVPASCNSDMSCAVAGVGGAAYGDEQLVPLSGGSLGGKNSAVATSSRQAIAGGGGGAIQLVSCGDLAIGGQAIVDASGGGGGGGFPSSTDAMNASPGAGAGGGSGGAILIEALRVMLEPGAILVANGGGGGGGARAWTSSGSGQGGGMGMGAGMGTPAVPGMAGQDGRRSSVAALGGQSGGLGAAPGGAGGTANPPAAGGAATQVEAAAGGGGGAAGRIRVNSQSGSADLTGLVVSPRATAGGVEID
jgi:hypothetical protein